MATAHSLGARGDHPEQPLQLHVPAAIQTHLGIQAPYTPFTLLGLREGETNLDTIRNAAIAILTKLNTKNKEPGVSELMKEVQSIARKLMNAAQQKNSVATGTESVKEQVHLVVSPTPSTPRTAEHISTWQKHWKGLLGVASTIVVGAAVVTGWYASSGDEKKGDPVAEKTPDDPITPPAIAQVVTPPSAAPTIAQTVAPMPPKREPALTTPSASPSLQFTTTRTPTPTQTQSSAPNPPAENTTVEKEAPSAQRKEGTPERNLGTLAGGDAAFKREEIDATELTDALEKVRAAFPNDNAETLLSLLTKQSILESPVRIKAVLETAMERATASKSASDITKVFNAMLAYPQCSSNTELEAHATTVLDALSAKGDLIATRTMLRTLAERGELFSKEFIIKRTTDLFERVKVKTGDSLLTIVINDLTELGAMTDEKALRAKASDLYNQSKIQPLKPDRLKEISLEANELAREAANMGLVDLAVMLHEFAKKTMPSTQRKNPEVVALVTATQLDIDHAKKIHDFTKILEGDPSNKAALQGRADIYLVKGNIDNALTDRAQAGDELAVNTVALRANPQGNACYACAMQWMQQAEQTMNGRKHSMHTIALALLQSALSATEDQLDEITREAATMHAEKLGMLVQRNRVQAKPAPTITITPSSIVAKNTSTPVQTTPRTKSASAEKSIPQWESFTHQIDFSKATVSYELQKDKTLKISTAGTGQVLPLPITLPAKGDFKEHLRFTLSRIGGENAFELFLPIEGSKLVFNGWPNHGYKSGLSTIDGVNVSQNQSGESGVIFPENGKPMVIDILLEQTDDIFSVECILTHEGLPRGKRVIQWKGERKSLSYEREIEVMKGNNIYVHPCHSAFVIANMERLKMSEPPKKGR